MPTLVTPGVHKKISSLHAAVLPSQNAEKPWIGSYKGKQRSYKDIYAQANCVAAFLMDAGVKKGDPVAIVSAAHPLYLALDLALQYIGAVNMTLPRETQSEGLRRIHEKHPFAFIFLSSAPHYLELSQLSNIRGSLKNVVIFEDDVEGIDPEKIITFERLVNQGKAIWRERPEDLQQRKDQIGDEDVCSLLWKEGRFEAMSFSNLASRIDQALLDLKKLPEGSLLSSLGPWHPEQRIYGFFAPMMSGRKVWCIATENIDTESLKKIQAAALVVPARFAGNFYKELAAKLFPNNAKASVSITKATKIYEKVDECQSAGKKVPVLTKMKYSSLRRGVFSKVKKNSGNRLHTFILGPGTIEAKGKDFWRHAGLELLQPNP